MITIPLFKRHRIICRVAGHGLPVVKLLPPLLEEEDRAWICSGFDAVLADCASPTGAVCDLLRHLATHAAKAKMATIAR